MLYFASNEFKQNFSSFQAQVFNIFESLEMPQIGPIAYNLIVKGFNFEKKCNISIKLIE